MIDAPKTVSTGDRSFFEHVRACTLPPAGLELPPLESALDPDFRWPNVDFAIQGFSTFRTGGAAGMSHLGRSLARIDGWGNFGTGRFTIETRLLAHDVQVAPPAPAAMAV